MNYTENKQKSQVNTWLYMSFKEDITEDIGDVLPYPQKHYINSIATYCWLLDGYFGTTKGIEFLNDVVARFKITYPHSTYSKHFNDSSSTLQPLKLKEFQKLKSKAFSIARDYRSRAETIYLNRDTVFWHLKLYFEDEIRRNGIVIYSEFERYALSEYPQHKKGSSTIRAKCRGIYHWYADRDFKIGRVKTNKTKEEIMATRQEHAKKIAKNKSELHKKKVLNLTTGMFKDEYKKKNGKWNISKIAKDSGTSRPTVMKYLPKETLF